MIRKSLPLILLLLILLLAACSEQTPADSAATDLPPEPGTDVAQEAVSEGQESATPTESADAPAPSEIGAPLTFEELRGISWEWRDLVDSGPAGQSDVPDPQNYSIVFLNDGELAIEADCNNVRGSYLLDAGQLRIILGPSTMAFCGDESLDVQFLNLLSKTTSGILSEDGRLKLFTGDGSTLGFDNGGEPTQTVVDGDLSLIANVLWLWQDLVETQPAGQSIVPDPQAYTIGFRYDGTLQVQADCNNVLGEYEIRGNAIAFTFGPSTMASCGEESLDTQYMELLNSVTTFSIEGGRFELSTSDGATLGFSNGGSLPGTIGLAPDAISLDTTGVAETWHAYVVPETLYDASMPHGPFGLPEHVEITFNGQTPDDLEDIDPVMYIIPVAAYEAMYELSDDSTITRMMNQIAAMTYDIPEPPPTSGMPVLPLERAGAGYNDLAVSVSRGAPRSESATKNGFRFIGRWKQDANPVTNEGLTYVYQGFTNDGAFLVSYWHPVRLDALPDDVSGVSQELMDAFNSDPLSQINVQAANLNGMTPADWMPDLNNLDALMASLQIDGMVSAGVQGKTWIWTGRGPANGEAAPVENPAQYRITYNNDGTFNYQADCNVGGGGFSVIGGFNGGIRHALGPSTLAACPSDSRADEFVGAIAAADAFRMLPGGHKMQLLLPAGGDVLTFTDAQFVDVDLPEPEAGLPTATVTAPEGIFVRTGPATNYPSLGVAAYGETGTIVGRSEDGQWWVIDAPAAPSGQVWVSAAFVTAVGADDVPVVATPLLPTPVPTPTPVPPPSPSVSFSADTTVVNKGDCATLRWNVENIQAIWVYPSGSNHQDFPQTGQGRQIVCPEQTTTYEMRVLHVDGTTEIRSITVQVNQPNTLADSSWALTSLNGNQLLLPESNLTLQFVGESNANAGGGCNTFSGSYAVYFTGISIGPLAGTQVACDDDIDTQETVFIQALQSATTFSQNGDVLVLYGVGNVEVARFSALRAVPRPGG